MTRVMDKSSTDTAFAGLQGAVDAACTEIDRLREVNSVCVAKLRELV